MRLWLLALSLILGMVVGWRQPETDSVLKKSTEAAGSNQEFSESFLPQRRSKSEQEAFQIPKALFDQIRFDKLIDTQVTPIAQHVLGLTPEQCAAASAFLAERDAALASYKKRMEMAAFLVEKREDALVIEVPSDPDAVLQIEKDCWDDLVSTLGKARTQFLIGDIRVQNATHAQKDILTIQNDGRYHRLQFTEHEGRRYSPTRTEAPMDSLPSHWDTILLGLAEE